MPWHHRKPTAAKYNTREHRARRAALTDQLERDGALTCAQPECVMPARIIRLGKPWALGHNDTGSAYIGPVHKRCNNRDGARRGNRRARGPPDQPGIAGRWVLRPPLPRGGCSTQPGRTATRGTRRSTIGSSCSTSSHELDQWHPLRYQPRWAKRSPFAALSHQVTG